VLFAMEGASTAPTEWELAQMEILSAKLPVAAAEVRKLIAEDLAALNAMILEAKIPHIQPPALPGGPGARPPGTEDQEQP